MEPAVRACITTWLIGLLILCPQLCGGDGSDQAARHHDAGHSRNTPAHCPGDAENCICQGAVQVDQVRVPDSGILATAELFADLAPPAGNLADPGLEDGAWTGLARWGSPLEVRAFLQNFRC
jgi:hypothetical protein